MGKQSTRENKTIYQICREEAGLTRSEASEKMTAVSDSKIEKFEYKGYKITNFEMESSALAGLSKLMGHKAMTVCMVIANRLIKEANTGYKNTIDTLIKTVLDRI